MIAAFNLVATYGGTTGDKWSTANVVKGATAATYGSGASNMDLILQNDATAVAAKRSSDLSIAIDGVTYDDWYFPSLIELQKLRTVYTQINSGWDNKTFWSSTEESSTNAARIRFMGGAYFSSTTTYINNKSHVTAIRKFLELKTKNFVCDWSSNSIFIKNNISKTQNEMHDSIMN